MKPTEKRSIAGKLTPVDGKPSVLRGYAAKFDSPSQDLGGFTETIKKGAFSRSLSSTCEIFAFAHHDSSKPLARRSAGTLTIAEDDVGLAVEIQLADTSHARDVASDIQAGNIDGMSFTFRVNQGGQRWSAGVNGLKSRELTDVELIEVSPVTMPAYLDTEVSARALTQAPAEEPAKAVSSEVLRKLSDVFVRLITLAT